MGTRADNHHDASRGVSTGRGRLTGGDGGKAARVRAELGRDAEVRAVQKGALLLRRVPEISVDRALAWCAWRGRWTGGASWMWLGFGELRRGRGV